MSNPEADVATVTWQKITLEQAHRVKQEIAGMDFPQLRDQELDQIRQHSPLLAEYVRKEFEIALGTGSKGAYPFMAGTLLAHRIWRQANVPDRPVRPLEYKELGVEDGGKLTLNLPQDSDGVAQAHIERLVAVTTDDSVLVETVRSLSTPYSQYGCARMFLLLATAEEADQALIKQTN